MNRHDVMTGSTSSTPSVVAHDRPAVAKASDAAARVMPLAIFVGAHIILALLMHVLPFVATAHALGCLLLGVFIAARRPMDEVALAVGYIAGSEVLWRMSHAAVFWEYGKYAISIVLVVALLRASLRRNVVISITYFALLVPSAILTVLALSPEAARQQLSFNLSGPLALTLSVLFFSNVRLSGDRVRLTFAAVIAPVVGIATVAYFSTTRAEEIEFTSASNLVTSGGFGPNQVSAMLGLGLLMALLLLLERRIPWRLRGPLLVVAVVFAVEAALTFSRGGLALAFFAAFAAMFYFLRNRRTRLTLVVLGALLFGVGRYVVIPRLEQFTAGKLSERYTKSDTSGRALLAGYDIEIFKDNFALGVGPGVAVTMRYDMGHYGAAHTEFTRMLAEHGVLGALALVLLVVLGVRTVRNTRGLSARAFVVALTVWVALFLLVNAMRLAAPAVMFGLACSIAYASQRSAQALTLTKAAKADAAA